MKLKEVNIISPVIEKFVEFIRTYLGDLGFYSDDVEKSKVKVTVGDEYELVELGKYPAISVSYSGFNLVSRLLGDKAYKTSLFNFQSGRMRFLNLMIIISVIDTSASSARRFAEIIATGLMMYEEIFRGFEMLKFNNIQVNRTELPKTMGEQLFIYQVQVEVLTTVVYDVLPVDIGPRFEFLTLK